MDYNVKLCYTAFLEFQNTVKLRGDNMKIFFGWSDDAITSNFVNLNGLYQFIFKYAIGRY